MTSVVNCTKDIPNFYEDELDYFNFDITWWKRHTGCNRDKVAFIPWVQDSLVTKLIQE